MIKSLFYTIFIISFTVICSIKGVLFAFIGKSEQKIHDNVARFWANTILKVCGVKVIIEGAENIDDSSPKVYMSNHQSAFDIYALLGGLPVGFRFIMKQELMNIPIFGYASKKAGYIGLERKDPRKAIKSMNDAANRIKNGSSVLIFPEGTRSPDGTLLEFKKGGFHLAVKSGCDIVPISIVGSREINPARSIIIHSGIIRIKIGKPIAVKEFSRHDMDKLMSETKNAINTGLSDQAS